LVAGNLQLIRQQAADAGIVVNDGDHGVTRAACCQCAYLFAPLLPMQQPACSRES
jgi:hypothetical protein